MAEDEKKTAQMGPVRVEPQNRSRFVKCAAEYGKSEAQAMREAFVLWLKMFDPKPPDCPKHEEVQHRDRRRPWCDACGWRHRKPAHPAEQVKEKP